jgi:FlaA1/EpsC-like NDP-sugar epimerase
MRTSIISKIVNPYKEIKIESHIVPSLINLISDRITVNALHKISIEDLLVCDQVKLD